MQNTTLRQLLPAASTSMEQSVPMPIRPRKRSTKNTSVACQRCRQYKTKCNGTSPCSACLKKGAKDCIYEAANSREALRQRNESLKRELAQMKGLGAPIEQSDSPRSSTRSSFSSSVHDFASTSPTTDSSSPKAIACGASSSSSDTVRDGEDAYGENVALMKRVADITATLRNLARTTTDMNTRDSLLALLQTTPEASALQSTPTKPLAEEPTQFVFEHDSFVSTAVVPEFYQQPLPEYAQQSMPGYAAIAPTVTETGFNISASSLPGKPIATSFGSFPPVPAGVFPTDSPLADQSGNVLEVVSGNVATPAERRAGRARHFYEHSPPYSSMSFASGIKSNYHPAIVQAGQIDNLSAPAWSIQTLWLAEQDIPIGPAKWASSSFIGIRNRGRWMIENNAPIESIIGVTSLHPLLEDRRRDPTEEVNVSDWAQAFMSNFPHVNVPDRVACWAILWRVLRWQAYQTPDTFAHVPVWCRPSPSETFVPHMPILICLAWPALRKWFVEQAGSIDWVEAVMGSISVSWPHGDNAVFKRGPNGSLVMSDAFETWIEDANNWSLSRHTTRAIRGVEGRALLR